MSTQVSRGQVASSATAIYTATESTIVNVTLYNTSGSLG